MGWRFLSVEGRWGGVLLLIQRGTEALQAGAAEFVHVFFFLFVAAARAILTNLLRKIQYFYAVLAYGASTPALIYPLANH